MFNRLRRKRINSTLRNMLTEVRLDVNSLIYPLFIREGEGIRNEITSMPDVFQLSIDEAIKECKEAMDLGIKAVILFGIPNIKDSVGSEALDDEGIVAKGLRELKRAFPELLLIADLCFCEYTDHGHCGILDLKHNTVENDATLKILAKQAVVLAKAGADVLAPSGMIDGMVITIREALDNNGFYNLPIMSYSTKFASAFYGPFRDAAESKPSFGDRKSYQLNFANRYEAILESLEDEAQGADILMVKPALSYLDIIRDIKERTLLPLAAYNVSGEYSMLKAAHKLGYIDYEKVLIEILTSIKRAGADLIITYHAKEVAKML